MANKKLEAMPLNTPQQVYDYFNVVNGYDKVDVPEEIEECIPQLIDRYDDEDIRYVLGSHKGVAEMVVFDMGYFDSVLDAKRAEEKAKKANEQTDVAVALKTLTNVITNSVVETKGEEIVKWAEDKLYEKHGAITRKLEIIKVDGKKLEGTIHRKFTQVSRWLTLHYIPLLVGPAGSGKNILCEQLAEALGAECIVVNAVQNAYDLIGYTGTTKTDFIEKPFYRACKLAKKKPVVFVFDELDGSIPEVMVEFNNALANKKYTFPNGETLEFGENLYIIACANTWGTGATSEYVGRNQLDAATLNRFKPIIIDYDPAVEESLCEDKELLSFIRIFRNQCKSHGIKHIVSYRDIQGLADMFRQFKSEMSKEDIEETIRNGLIKELARDDLGQIVNNIEDLCDEYGKYVRNVYDEMESEY